MELQIHYDPNGEWAALYRDGKLVTVGDRHVAEEAAFDLLGVVVEQDNAFLRGQGQRDGVAQTLHDLEVYRIARDQAASEAARLRVEAQMLLDRAAELEA